MKKIIVATFILVALVSCKTQEEIQREQMIENLAVQMVDNQKLAAESTVKIQSLEEEINQLQGNLATQSHESQVTVGSRLSDLETRIKIIENQNLDQNASLEKLQSSLEAQKEYIDKVLQTLKGITAKKKTTRAKKKTDYGEAVSLYRGGKYSASKPYFLKVLNNKKSSADQKAHSLHNLGMIYFMEKKFEESISSFSSMMVEHSGSPYQKNGMLYLAKSFLRQKKTDEAKQTLEELEKQYPKSKQANEAKKLLAKL